MNITVNETSSSLTYCSPNSLKISHAFLSTPPISLFLFTSSTPYNSYTTIQDSLILVYTACNGAPERKDRGDVSHVTLETTASIYPAFFPFFPFEETQDQSGNVQVNLQACIYLMVNVCVSKVFGGQLLGPCLGQLGSF